MAAAWPGTLPEYFLSEGYTEKDRNNTIRTQNDIGLPSMRNRYTTTITDISAKMRMDQSQVDTLLTFYRTTLDRVGTFNITNPVNSVTYEMRFLSAPSLASMGGEIYDVTFQLESY